MDPNADKNMFFNNLERLNKKSCPLAVGKNLAATKEGEYKAQTKGWDANWENKDRTWRKTR